MRINMLDCGEPYRLAYCKREHQFGKGNEMRAWRVVSDQGIDALELTELPEEPLGELGVRVRMRAASLNYRDLGVVAGGYLRNDRRPVIALSDGAGEVLEVGPGVTKWQPGDRVCPIFVRDWLQGLPDDAVLETCLGGGVDGVLAEQRVIPESSLVRVPDHLSYAEGATLPCAALTAWNALFESGRLQPGESVLVLGTGGVSLFALQFARMAGARVMVTSSSDEKLAQAIELGAEATVNYRAQPEWQVAVREWTAGRGVDHVVEVGGPGTLERSMKAARVGGSVHLIGVLDTPAGKVGPLATVFNCLRIQGIYVGSRAMFEQMNRAVTTHRLRPVIDSVYPFDQAREAYHALARQQHMGKLVIEFPD